MMLFSRCRALAWFCLFGVLIVAQPLVGRAASQWRILETPRFTLITQGREREATQWAQDFSQFIHALHGVISVREEWLPAQTMVVFRRERDFRPYKPVRPDGKIADVAGFYGRRETWSVIGLTDNFRSEELRRVIFHEGVHWFMSASTERQPLWLSEGIR